jgi:hypothetical protein
MRREVVCGAVTQAAAPLNSREQVFKAGLDELGLSCPKHPQARAQDKLFEKIAAVDAIFPILQAPFRILRRLEVSSRSEK